MRYELRKIKGAGRRLIIPQQLGRSLGLTRASALQVSFGLRSERAIVRPTREVPDGVIYASAGLMQKLGMPVGVTCQVAVKKKGLAIGPYIGVLVSREDDRLLRRRLKRLLPDAATFTDAGGILLAFALKQADQQSQTITGYIYNRESKSWQPASCGYPAAIYRRIGLGASWREHFISNTGQRMFNSYFWDKWELYGWTKPDDRLTLHVPETVLYSSWRDVLQMLDRFGAAFVKPAAGMRGAATLLVQREGGQLLLRQNNGYCQVLDEPSAVEAIIKHCSDRRYLVQRYIPLLQWQGGVVDFRVLMQKDDLMQWGCQGIIARVGPPGSIVSNISRRGKAYPLEEFARQARPELGERIDRWGSILIQAAEQVCRVLDERDLNIGTLGLDIGIDYSGHWWLIEANNRDPDPSIALDAGCRELYSKLRLNPLLYARALAGFRRSK